LAGGIEAMVMRLQLSHSDANVLGPEAYNQLFTVHGITMIFWYASPILSGFGNYLVPLMIGSRDMALPRTNAFSYWTFALSGLFLYTSLCLGQAPHGGWFAYLPYTDQRFSPDLGMDFYALALLFLTISTTAGAIRIAVGLVVSRSTTLTVTSAGGLVFPWPYKTAPGKATLNGKRVKWKTGEIRILSLPATVIIRAK
jgi:cytochrome c oxidase subunit 1/cytochrome c oxidase subunit I+III